MAQTNTRMGSYAYDIAWLTTNFAEASSDTIHYREYTRILPADIPHTI